MFFNEKFKELEQKIQSTREKIERDDNSIIKDFNNTINLLQNCLNLLTRRITEIENAIYKINSYAEENNYTVMDIEEGVNNIFKDVKSAKEFINKMNQKNKPFKINKRLQKALKKGEKNA